MVIPDRIFVPVGNGETISAIYKGFEDLFRLNSIERIPTGVAVQSSQSDYLIKNFDSNTFSDKSSTTIADSMSKNFPRNFHMTRKFILQYKGECNTVGDNENFKASYQIACNTSILAESAAAAAYPGFLQYFKRNSLRSGTKNVVLLTGSGLKDIRPVKTAVHLPPPIDPSIHEIEKHLKL
jgi:threonine synthase